MKCRKILCALLATLTVTTSVPMTVFAAQTEEAAQNVQSDAPADETHAEEANISGNLVNGGMATTCDDIIYYSNSNDNGCLYAEEDGRLRKLTEFGVQYLNVGEDGSLYYTVVDGNEGLTKIGRYDPATGETGVLFAIDMYQGIKNLIVKDGKCYFITNGTVQSLDIQTGAREALLGGASNVTSFLFFDGGYAYGSVTESGTTPITVYQYETMCSVTVTETGAGFDISDGYVYYADSSDEYRMHRVALDGSGDEALTDIPVCNIVAMDDGVYYKDRTAAVSEILKYDPSKDVSYSQGAGSCTEFTVLPDEQIVTTTAAVADASMIEEQANSGSRVGMMATGEYQSWKQYDSRWATKMVGDGGTMRAIGCLVTSIAICAVDSGVRSEETFDPGVFVDLLNNNGGFASGGNLYWYKIAQVLPEFSVNVWNTNLSGLSKEEKNAIIQSHLDAGREVVVSVKYGGHWVAVNRIIDDDVLIFDPGYNIDLLYGGYDHASLKQLAAFDVKGSSGNTTPSEELVKYVVTGENLQYRDKPSTSGASKGSLQKGSTVMVVSGYQKEADGHTWYKILVGSNYYYVCSSYLEKETPAADSVTLDKKSAVIEIGDTVKLTATVSPSDADNTVTWSSSDTSVATVKNGVVTGVKAGKATITVKTTNGKTASCEITVNKKETLLSYRTTDYLNYRSGPSLSYGVVGTLKPNINVSIVEGATVKADGYTWHKLKLNDKYYYASATYLEELAPTVGAVSGLKATVTTKQAALTWNKVDGADGYLVYYRKNGTSTWTKVASTDKLTYTVTGLSANTKYDFAVKAYKTVSGKNYYGTYPVISATTEQEEVLLSYVTTDQLNYRSTPSTSGTLKGTLAKGTAVQVVSGYSKTADGVKWYKIKIGSAYYYASAEYLKEKSSVTVGAVSGLKAAVTTKQAALTWNKVDGATGYLVYYRKNGTSTWTKVASTDKLTYTVTGLSANTKYDFAVKAYKTVSGQNYYGTYPVISATTEQEEVLLSYVTTDQLNYRSSPSTSGTLKGTLAKGTEVKVVSGYSKTADGVKWYKIKIGSAYYYASAEYLKEKSSVTVGAVSGLKAAVTTKQAALTWNKVDGATGYLVYYRKNGTSTWTKVASTDKLTYTVTGLSANTKYDFAVKAYKTVSGKNYYGTYPVITAATAKEEVLLSYVTTDQLNYRSSPSTSGTLKGTLAKGTAVKVVSGYSKTADGVKWYKIKIGSAYYYASAEFLTSTSVAKVSGLKASTTTNSVSLSWDKVSGATGYIVYRRKADDSGWTKIKTITGLSYTDGNLNTGKVYQYAVRAYKTAGSKNYYGAYPTLRVATKPAKLSGFKVSAATANSVTVQWNKISNVTGYLVYYRKAGASSWTKAGSTTGTSYTCKNLSANTKYEFAAKAYIQVDGKEYAGAYPTTSATTKAAETLLSYVTTDQLNYRSSPSTSGALKGTLKKGTAVKVVSGYSKTADGIKWYKIKIGTSYYYASSEYLKKA